MALTANQNAMVSELAVTYGIPTAFALGIIDKESAGVFHYKIGKERLPAIRYEGHYLYRLLKNNVPVRTKAVKLGFAAKSAGVVKNSNTMSGRYAKIKQIAEFLLSEGVDVDLVYQSISIGVGQVMGSHYQRLGYSTAQQMLQGATASEEQQVYQFLFFIHTDKNLLRHAQDFNYKAFGIGYNGKAAPASYWITLEKFVKGYLGDQPAANPILARIYALGYDNVMSFQQARGIKVDGIIGPITQQQLEYAEKELANAQPKPPVSPVKAIAGAAAVTTATTVASYPDIIGAVVPVIDPVTKAVTTLAPLGLPFVIAAAVAVIGVAVFVIIKNRK